jgi:hypothetical protein
MWIKIGHVGPNLWRFYAQPGGAAQVGRQIAPLSAGFVVIPQDGILL